MFKKFAAALIVASLVATPVLAQSMPSDTAPINLRAKPHVTKKVVKVKAHKVTKLHKITKAKKYAKIKKYKVKKSKFAKSHKPVKQVRAHKPVRVLKPVKPIT